MGFGGFLWPLGDFYGVWGHLSHPLSESGGIWVVLGSFHHLQIYATMVEVGFLVGLGSCWPNSVPDFGGNLWGLGGFYGVLGVFMGFGVTPPILSQNLGGFGGFWGHPITFRSMRRWLGSSWLGWRALGPIPCQILGEIYGIWGVFMGFGVTSHILSQNLGGFGVIPSPSGLRNDGWDLPGWVGEILAQFRARF